MYKLKILFKDKIQQDILLDPNQIYFAGRSEGCQILLNPEKGISRQHFKVYFNGEKWTVEALSKVGDLFFNTQKVETIELNNADQFEVPPYVFKFYDREQTTIDPGTVVKSLTIENLNLAEVTSQASQLSLAPDQEKTFVGVVPQLAFLKVLDSVGETKNVFRLEGEAWIAGRDTGCNLFIDHPHLSRRQFEIQKNDGQFCIINLSHVNHTLLNGSEVPFDQWVVLTSGDVISVVDINIHFELRDALFDKKLKEVDPNMLSSVVYKEEPQTLQNQSGHILVPLAESEIKHKKQTVEEDSKKIIIDSNPYIKAQISAKKQKSNQVLYLRLAIVAALAVGLIFHLNTEDASVQESASMGQPKLYDKKFEKLTKDKQKYIEDSYRLADSLFRQGKYELARQETVKIHQYVSYYEESKNIEKLAEVAIQTQVDKQRADALELAKKQAEDKITRQVSYCRKNISEVTEMSDVDLCLSSVISLNPEHPLINNLKAEVEKMITHREIRKSERNDYNQKVMRQKYLFETAQRFHKKEELNLALQAYQEVVSSKLPDPKGYKQQSKRQIASLQGQIQYKISDILKTSDSEYKKGNFKNAIMELKKGYVIDPQNNQLISKEKAYTSDLKKQMQILYQEGILEESVGEVETAKNKWKKILSSSLPEEEYYKKALIKLKKYEAQ